QEERERLQALKAAAKETLGWCATKYIDAKAEKYTGAQTANIRRGWIVNHVPDDLHAKSIKKITKADIIRILAGMKPRGETAWALLGLLKRIIDYAHDKEWRVDSDGPNPADKIRPENHVDLEWMDEDNSQEHPEVQPKDMPRLWPL